jgi:hypothetical protein
VQCGRVEKSRFAVREKRRSSHFPVMKSVLIWNRSRNRNQLVKSRNRNQNRKRYSSYGSATLLQLPRNSPSLNEQIVVQEGEEENREKVDTPLPGTPLCRLQMVPLIFREYSPLHGAQVEILGRGDAERVGHLDGRFQHGLRLRQGVTLKDTVTVIQWATPDFHHFTEFLTCLQNLVLRIQILDPEVGFFSGFWISDPRSQTRIFDSLMTNFWEKNNNS